MRVETVTVTVSITRYKLRQPTWPLLVVVGGLEVVREGQVSTEEV